MLDKFFATHVSTFTSKIRNPYPQSKTPLAKLSSVETSSNIQKWLHSVRGIFIFNFWSYW